MTYQCNKFFFDDITLISHRCVENFIKNTFVAGTWTAATQPYKANGNVFLILLYVSKWKINRTSYPIEYPQSVTLNLRAFNSIVGSHLILSHCSGKDNWTRLYIYVYYTHSDITLSRIRIHLNECPILNNNIIEPKKTHLISATHLLYFTHEFCITFFYVLIVLS